MHVKYQMHCFIKITSYLTFAVLLASCVFYETVFMVRGQILTEDGTPINGCEVALRQIGSEEAPMGNTPLKFPSVFTDTYIGQFEPEELLFLRVTCPSYDSFEETTAFSAGLAIESWPEPYDVGIIVMKK